jgi:hypothetical protein
MKLKIDNSGRKTWFSFLLIFFTITANAQSSGPVNTYKSNSANSLVEDQIKYIKKAYSTRIEAPKEIINGKEYESYYRQSKSKPLLFAGKPRTGTIYTSTRQYDNVNLQYDTYQDEVIYTDTSRTINFRYPEIALNKNLVLGFKLNFPDESLYFKFIKPEVKGNENLSEGFYEVAYEGKSKYFIRHISKYYQRDAMNEYKYSAVNYINAGNGFVEVVNKKSFLKLFGSKEPEIKNYLHTSKIKIRHKDKTQFISVLKFYDSLPK